MGIKAVFVQSNPVFGDVEKNAKEALELAESESGDLIVMPELFNTGYAFLSAKEAYELSEKVPDGITTRRILQASESRQNTVVFGLAERSGKKVFNSAAVVSKGRFLGVYRKLHLFYKEKQWFAPGNLPLRVLNLDGYRLGVMVCFDWIYPEVARTLALLGADIIAHPSNLVLPGYCQKAMLARSFENRVFTITANRTGFEKRGGDEFRYTGSSQIVNPEMEVLASASPTEVAAKSAEIDPSIARNKNITRLNNIFADRRVKFYARLLEPLPEIRAVREP